MQTDLLLPVKFASEPKVHSDPQLYWKSKSSKKSPAQVGGLSYCSRTAVADPVTGVTCNTPVSSNRQVSKDVMLDKLVVCLQPELY